MAGISKVRDLYYYASGEYARPASVAEAAESDAAAEIDGGVGAA